jgi:hypothetical protein
MTIRLTYFVHGTTTDNEQHLSSGWNDVALSALGIQQSKDLAELTKQHAFDVVFTSDLSRAVESARLAWGDKYPLIQDARLRECNYGGPQGTATGVGCTGKGHDLGAGVRQRLAENGQMAARLGISDQLKAGAVMPGRIPLVYHVVTAK